MFVRRKHKGALIPLGSVKQSFGSLHHRLNRLMILNSVWEKETGRMSIFWELEAVKDDTLFVKTKSAAAAQELKMRCPSLMRNLNKYFDRPWIKAIKPV